MARKFTHPLLTCARCGHSRRVRVLGGQAVPGQLVSLRCEACQLSWSEVLSPIQRGRDDADPPYDAPPVEAPGALVSLEPHWRMRMPAGRLLVCASERTDLDFEVAVRYDTGAIVRRVRVDDLGAARRLAEEWRQAVLATEAAEELAVDGCEAAS